MHFHPIKQSKTFRTILHSNLLVVECKFDRIQFLIFDFAHQGFIYHTHFLFQNFQEIETNQDSIKKGYQFFNRICNKINDIVEIRNHFIFLTFGQTNKKQSLVFEIPLTQKKLSPDDSIRYLKQFSKAKQDYYRSEILHLKTKIYSLMTDVQDATSLIKAHSLQTKNSKEQIKNLKKELKILQDQKTKQKQICLIEVGVQHENSSDQSDIVQCLKSPQIKHFSLDQQKLKNLTQFIEKQIRENQKIIDLSVSVLPVDQNSTLRPFSQKMIPLQQKNLKEEQPRMTYSLKKPCYFKKPCQNFRPDGYDFKPLESA